MRLGAGVLTVYDATGIQRGDRLSFSLPTGPRHMRVLAVDGCEVTIGRWRWHHTAAWWVRIRATRARWAMLEAAEWVQDKAARDVHR